MIRREHFSAVQLGRHKIQATSDTGANVQGGGFGTEWVPETEINGGEEEPGVGWEGGHHGGRGGEEQTPPIGGRRNNHEGLR